MCFTPDDRPPIEPIAGGALDAEEIVLTAEDGARLRAFRARPTTRAGIGMLVLPDIRGLHPYYEELALRFAEIGVDAVAIDYFGRTAGTGPRGDEFEHMAHVEQATYEGLRADIRAGIAELRRADPAPEAIYTVGFCFGGRLAFLSATMGLDLAGAIGFYGVPVGPHRAGTPAPAELADEMRAPILGLFGGADPAIPPTSVRAFDDALSAAGVEHRLVEYHGAPHSFFDRKAEQFADASAAAWDEVRRFIGVA